MVIPAIRAQFSPSLSSRAFFTGISKSCVMRRQLGSIAGRVEHLGPSNESCRHYGDRNLLGYTKFHSEYQAEIDGGMVGSIARKGNDQVGILLPFDASCQRLAG